MLRAVTESSPTFLHRIVIAVASFFRILANAHFASRVRALSSANENPKAHDPEPTRPVHVERDLRPALQLLSLLQREGRFVDFLQQDILAFSDADVGAAARVVHEGCRRALQRVAQLAPVQEDPEGHSVTVPSGFDATSLVLTGNVSGSPPFHGTLRHRGWRAQGFSLPEIIGDSDLTVIAPAEVEL